MALAGIATATDGQYWEISSANMWDGVTAGNRGSAVGISFTLSNDNDRLTIVGSPDNTLELPTTLGLQTITFDHIQADTKTGTPGAGDYYLYITTTGANETNKTVVGQSSSAINISSTGRDTDNSTYTFSFDTLKLAANTEYFAYFVEESKVSTAVNSVTKVFTPSEANGLIGMQLGTGYGSSTDAHDFSVISATGYPAPAYTADVTFKVVAVPEPTTATLSLLALAGLAARRRRK